MNIYSKPIQVSTKADIQKQISRCQQNADLCEDVIKQLRGATPDNFVFSFSIRGREIVKFEIAESESEFTIGYFMSWLTYYRRDITTLKAML